MSVSPHHHAQERLDQMSAEDRERTEAAASVVAEPTVVPDIPVTAEELERFPGTDLPEKESQETPNGDA